MSALKPQFETFLDLGSQENAYITIGSTGVLRINKQSRALLGNPSYVELLFDPRQRIVGVRPVDKYAASARSVRSGDGIIGSGIKFTVSYGIRPMKIPAKLQDGVLMGTASSASSAQ